MAKRKSMRKKQRKIKIRYDSAEKLWVMTGTNCYVWSESLIGILKEFILYKLNPKRYIAKSSYDQKTKENN